MDVLISSLHETNLKIEASVNSLFYDDANEYFWMHLCIGDDWNQRVTSSLDFSPRLVHFFKNNCFIVCDEQEQCNSLYEWLTEAEKRVQYGYATMRG